MCERVFLNAIRATEKLINACGIAPKDTNVAMIYDNFTPQVLRQLEGFGYCGLGEAKDYVADGNLELDGKTSMLLLKILEPTHLQEEAQPEELHAATSWPQP